jgi:hypothetical protein
MPTNLDDNDVAYTEKIDTPNFYLVSNQYKYRSQHPIPMKIICSP